jgi:hypothetical protein
MSTSKVPTIHFLILFSNIWGQSDAGPPPQKHICKTSVLCKSLKMRLGQATSSRLATCYSEPQPNGAFGGISAASSFPQLAL